MLTARLVASVLTPTPPLLENTVITLREAPPPPCLRAASAATRSTAALKASRSSGRRSTSWAPARIARTRVSGLNWSVDRNSTTSGCCSRYWEAACSASSPLPASSSSRIEGSTWWASAMPARRSERSPAICTPGSASRAERSWVRSMSLRWTRTTDSSVFMGPPVLLDQLNGEGGDCADRAAAGPGDDAAHELAVEASVGAGVRNVLDEELREPGDRHRRASPVSQAGGQRHGDEALAVAVIVAVADVLPLVGVLAEAVGHRRLQRRHVAGLGHDLISHMERAAVAVLHQALEGVGSGGLPSAAIPVVAGREIDGAVVPLGASLAPLLEHVVLVTAGMELVAGRRHDAHRNGTA